LYFHLLVVKVLSERNKLLLLSYLFQLDTRSQRLQVPAIPFIAGIVDAN